MGRITDNIDFDNGARARNLQLESRATDPAAAGLIAGRLWWDSATSQIKYADGSTAKTIGSGGGSAPATATVTVTGNGTTTVFTVAHNLALASPFQPSAVTVLDPAGKLLSLGSYDADTLTANSFTVRFAVAPANGVTHRFRITA